MRRQDFIESAKEFSSFNNTSYWATQYDLVSVGYDGPEISVEAVILLEQELPEQSAESLPELLRRHHDITE